MVDLHTHILFDIDDGAKDVETSVKILKEAERAGIERVMLTPHFALGEDVDSFLKIRDERVSELRKRIEEEKIDVEIKAGAEVYITDDLYDEMSLSRLALGESDVILAEFKYHGVEAETFIGYIDEIIQNKLTPLVAHVERYSYVRRNPLILEALINRGVLLQVNAISLFEDSDEGEFARMLVKERLCYALCSDVHNAGSRRLRAMEKIGENEGYLKKLASENPEKIFDNGGW